MKITKAAASIIPFLLFCAAQLSGQSVAGRVTVAGSTPQKPLDGASVYWAGTNIGVSTSADGTYSIGMVKDHDRLVAAYVGFYPDTVAVGLQRTVDFALQTESLGEVVVTARSRGTIRRMDGILTSEAITFAGLTKMACCNLAESFENSASVTVGYSDAITGARQIRMLGIPGIYTQLMDETRPVMRGIGSGYAMGYIPGMWLESIQVSKGVTSVASGHEAMSGQINLEHRKPAETRRNFLNLYTDSEARTELNYYGIAPVNDELSNIVLLHGSLNPLRIDHNGDGFMDSPLTEQVNLANRWLWTPSNGMQLRGGVKYVSDSRMSGQMDFRPFSERRNAAERNISDPWGSQVENRLANAYVKLAVPVGKYVYDEETEASERSNVALIADYSHFLTDTYYGLFKEYRAKQNSGYINGMYSWNIDIRNRLVTGVTFIGDRTRQFLADGQLTAVNSGGTIAAISREFDEDRTQYETGIYAEYNYNYRDMFTLVAGMRADYWFVPRSGLPKEHRSGMLYTPRMHIRWSITPDFVLRGSAGLGSRTTNLISDNMWALATGRMLRLDDSPPGEFDRLDRTERSLTYGGSAMWTFRLGSDNGASLSFDYFHTEFLNQVIADQEFDTQWVYFYNLDGPSYSDVWQADFGWSPFNGFDVFATFRYNKTRTTLKTSETDSEGRFVSATVEKPLTDRYKGIINLQYATKFRRWVFDFTAQVNGPSRIPTQTGDLADSETSPAYMMYYAQVTWKAAAATEIYLGCENIGGYMQPHPVITSSVPGFEGNPHFPDFNPSLVWGPLMGRRFYAGVRINF